MTYIHDDYADAALNVIKNNADVLHILSGDPGLDYATVITNSLGTKSISSSNFTGPANDGTAGRKLTVGEFSDGSVNATGAATYFAIVDSGNTKVLASGQLAGGGQTVIEDNDFSIAAFDIKQPDP